jgi:hypothetical protein
MKLPPFYDTIAGIVTLILVGAVVLYPLFGVECPQIIGSGFAVALGWSFRATVAINNGVVNRARSASNGEPTARPPTPPALSI